MRYEAMEIVRINKKEVIVNCSINDFYIMEQAVFWATDILPGWDFNKSNWSLEEAEDFDNKMENYITLFFEENKSKRQSKDYMFQYTFSRREFTLIIETHTLTMRKFGVETYFDVIDETWEDAQSVLENLCKIQLLFLEEDKKK